MSERRRSHQHRRWALILGLLALCIYGSTLSWGVPSASAPDRVDPWSVDDLLPLKPLAEMHNTFVVSKPDRQYAYPWWHFFVVAVADAPYLGWAMMTGRLESPQPEFPFGFTDPVEAMRHMTYVGRLVTVLMAAGIVMASFRLASVLFDRRTGIVAGLLTMLCFPMQYYSGTGNLDVPVFFWTALGTVCFARILKKGATRRRLIWLGVYAALAIATKDQALVLFLPFAVVLLWRRFHGIPEGRPVIRPLLWGLGSSIVAYLIATGMLVDPMRHITHVRYLLFQPEMLTIADLYLAPNHDGGALLVGLVARLADQFGIVVLVAAVVGAGMCLRDQPRLLVLLVPLPLLFVMLVLPMGHVIGRYLLPFTLVLDALAAYALVRLCRSRWAPLGIAGMVLVFCGRGAIVADVMYAQNNDPRVKVTAWLEQNARPGERVEYFGAPYRLPDFPAHVTSGLIAGRDGWRGDFDHGPAVLEFLRDGGPEYVVVVPDWTSPPGLERSQDCPEEVFQALEDGLVGYTKVVHAELDPLFPSPYRRPRLDSPALSPPARLFARNDVARRSSSSAMTAGSAGETD